MTRVVAHCRDVIKQDDGFVATFFAAPLANWLLRRIESQPVSPNQVTALSVAAALAAASLFATGLYPALFLAAILLQGSFVLDCLDGQLARYRGETSTFGAWFDLIGDSLQDVVLFAGIAYGCSGQEKGAAPFLWGYAALLVVLYRRFDSMVLARVLGDDYATLLRGGMLPRDGVEKARIVETARLHRKPQWGWAGRVLDSLAPKATSERRPVVFWVKRALLLGGGELYLLVSLLAVGGKIDWILPAIVVWGVVVYPLISVRRWLLFGGR